MMKKIILLLTGLVATLIVSAVSGLFRLLPCAFSATNMNRIQGGTVTLWLYKSTDAVATIVASGYFNLWTDHLRENDVILVVGSSGGTQTVDVVVVSSADNAATVTVINGT